MTTLLALETNGALIATDQAGGVAVTQSGPLRFCPAKGARVNYCPNPRAQTNTGQALALGASVTVSRLTTDGPRAEAQTCFECVTPGGAASEGFFAYSMVAQSVVQTGKKLRVAFSAKRLKGISALTWIVQARDTNNASVEAFTGTLNLTGDWQRTVIECDITHPRAAAIALYIWTGVSTSAVTFRVSDIVFTVDDPVTTPLDLTTPGTNAFNPLTGYLVAAGSGPIANGLDAVVQPAETNFLINPSAENASITTGVAAIASATLTKSNEAARSGGNSAKIVTPGSVANEGLFFGSTGALGFTGSVRTFIGSVWVRGAAGQNLQVQLRGLYSDASQQVGTAVNFTTNGNWQRITAPAIATNAAKTLNNLVLYVWTQAASVVTFYADEAQVEESPFVTGYLDGSLGTGHSWSGTAHASTSSRTASVVTVPEAGHINMSRGSILVRFRRLTDTGTFETLFDQGAAATSYDRIVVWINSNDRPELYWQTNGAPALRVEVPTAVTLDVPHEIYAQWDGTATAISLDGGTLYTGQRDLPTNLLHPNDIHIGTLIGGSASPLVGAIGGILVTDTPLPDTTILPTLARVPWTISSLDVPVYYPVVSTDGRLVHQTRFGAVNFGIYWGGDPEGMPDWSAPFLTVARHVPGSSITKVQTLGKGALTVTYRLQLDSIEDFLALQALQGTTATLRVVGDTVTVPGTFIRVVDENFVDIDQVTLMGLGNVVVIPETREVDCDAVFLRQAS